MRKIAFLLYGIFSYLIFLAIVFPYSIGFLGDFGVPTSLDAAPQKPLALALIVDLSLLTIFALQHSVMARPWFKKWWTKFVPTPIERSTYCLFSNIAMIVVFMFWEPLGGTLWQVSGLGAVALYTLFGIGWVVILYSTFLLNHFELFGLRQVWLYWKGEPYTPLSFSEPTLYRYVRHPLYVGWIMVFWFTPTMTVSHLLFAVATTAYILIAIQFEERDLENALPGYAEYRRRVPMLVPLRSR